MIGAAAAARFALGFGGVAALAGAPAAAAVLGTSRFTRRVTIFLPVTSSTNVSRMSDALRGRAAARERHERTRAA